MKSKQAREREALALAMAAGAAIGRITPSRLMSPTELAVATRGRADLESKLGGWCLCTEMPSAMWQRALDAHAKGTPNKVMVAEAPTGRRYLIVVVRAADWQHRVCIPLLGQLTAQWLGALCSGKVLQMSMADAEGDQAFVSESVVPPDAMALLQGLDMSIPQDLPDFMEEAFRLVAWNAMVATEEPDAANRAPAEVSVSLLLPAEVEAHLEQRSEEWAERKLS